MNMEKIVTNGVYHIYTKSIAGFHVFNTPSDFERMKDLIKYYQFSAPPKKYSQLLLLSDVEKQGFNNYLNKTLVNSEKLVQIIAYCLMPTHLHLALKQLMTDGISTFMSNILNSFTRYLNTKINRKGPLWEGRFKKVMVKTDEQLLHLTRYIHLNPTTAFLVEKPEDWLYSSYYEYIHDADSINRTSNITGLLKIDPNQYKNFVDNQKEYQRDLAKIKKITIDY